MEPLLLAKPGHFARMRREEFTLQAFASKRTCCKYLKIKGKIYTQTEAVWHSECINLETKRSRPLGRFFTLT